MNLITVFRFLFSSMDFSSSHYAFGFLFGFQSVNFQLVFSSVLWKEAKDGNRVDEFKVRFLCFASV